MSSEPTIVVIGDLNPHIVEQVLDSLDKPEPGTTRMTRILRVPLESCRYIGDYDLDEWCRLHGIEKDKVKMAIIGGWDYDGLDLQTFVFGDSEMEFWPNLLRLSVVRLDDKGTPWFDEA